MDIETSRIDAQFENVRGDIRILADGCAAVSARAADDRRHIQVLLEAVRDDIRLLAEGLTAVSAKVDSLSH